MQKTQFELPGAYWLKTAPTVDGGVRLAGRYKAADYPDLVGGLVLFSGIGIAIYGYRSGMAELIVLGVAIFFASVLSHAVYEWRGKKLDMKIYPDRIGVRAGRSYKYYSRALPLEFRLEQHQKAAAEEDLEVRTRSRQKRKFRDAIEVVLQYGEKRIALADMPSLEIEKARQLLFRLQNVCEGIDAAAPVASGGRMGRAAAGDFGPAPDIR